MPDRPRMRLRLSPSPISPRCQPSSGAAGSGAACGSGTGSPTVGAASPVDASSTISGTTTAGSGFAATGASTGASGDPKMTVTCADQDFIKIRQKQLNPQMAAMSGKLKFKPMDMGLAMKLGKLLS